jgi:hypothetical protein
VVSIQSSYTSPSKCRCSSPSGNLVSCSLLTSYLCSLSCLSYGDVIYGTYVVYLVVYTIVGIARTIVGTANGSTLPLIIFCAFTFVLSYSLFTPGPNAPPSSTIIFFLRALLRESTTAFFLFSMLSTSPP